MFDEHVAGATPRPDPPDPSTPAAEPATTLQRFASCRWHKPAEAQQPAYCTHREVLPMAGATGFNAESWCPDCAFYKVKRKAARPSEG